MGSTARWLARLGCLIGCAAVLFSCATVNRLDRYSFDGATVAANLRVPPDPKLDIAYTVKFDSRNPVETALSIGTNLAMAAEASAVKSRMREAFLSVDVPSIVFDESFTACADAIGAEMVYRRFEADYLLDIEIRDYGIRAVSSSGAVSLVMHLTARLYDNNEREIIWMRDISVDDPATPYMFGVGNLVGNVVTAGVLANLSTQAITEGFEQLARASAKSLARKLERDLYSARYY